MLFFFFSLSFSFLPPRFFSPPPFLSSILERILCYDWSLRSHAKQRFKHLVRDDHRERRKILSWKFTRNAEEIVRSRSIFDSYRYLDRVPRYKQSKFPWYIYIYITRIMNGSALGELLGLFLEMLTTPFQESYYVLLCFPSSRDCRPSG